MGKSKDIQATKKKGAKAKKKKWNAGKEVEKIDYKVVFDEKTYKAFLAEVPKRKCITVAAVSSQYTISKGLAKMALKKLEQDGKIQLYQNHSKCLIWIPTPKAPKPAPPAEKEEEAKEAKEE